MRSIVIKRFNSTSTAAQALKKTALYDLHVELGATMVPFAGYSMPVLYHDQSHIDSHNWTRANAGLFDVSHMLQSKLTGPDAIKFLHKVTPTDFRPLEANTGTLSVLLNSKGGIVDDTMVTKINDQDFYVVTNAGCIDRDLEFLNDELTFLKPDCSWDVIKGRSLLALQGPKAHQVLQPLLKKDQSLKDFYFGQRRQIELSNGVSIGVARSGYTGEDGFEISVANEDAVDFAKALLDNEVTKLIGLAARDSLRLEAGMCLYGHELNEFVTPVEGALNWLITKSRRNVSDPNEVKFNGYENIMDQINNKTYTKQRVAFKCTKRGPAARTDARIFLPDATTEVGVVTSGSASPSLNNINIGQGYVQKGLHKKGTELLVQVRNKFYPIIVEKSPLVPTSYYRG